MTGSGLAVVDNIKLGYAIESTPGTTPSVAFQTLRPKTQSLTSSLKFVESNEFRFDRQVSDQVLSDSSPSGQVGGELSFGAWDDFMLGAVAQANWTSIFSANNIGVTSTSVISVPSGGLAVVANHIIKLSGFSTTSNNGIFVVASSTATSITVSGSPLTVEASGAAKTAFVWGFTSSSGDIGATASGLSSTSLNFTTLGLSVGAWIKIGGSATANQFATQANNAIVRITAISANVLSLDNLPTGWTIDAGTGRTIQVQISSFVRNGTTPQSYTIERWHTDISPNQYFLFRGCYIDKASFTLTPGQILETAYEFKGLGTGEGTSSASTGSYLPAPANPILNAVGNIARVQEGGNSIGFLKKLVFNVSNTTREQKAVGTLGNVGIGQGRYSVEVQFEAYFTSGSLYQKYLNATQTSLSFAVRDGLGNAYVLTAPAVKLTAATINAGGIGQDVMMQATAKGLIDPITGCMFQIDRVAA